MHRPVIGITVDRCDTAERYESPFTYAKAIELAGGLPVLLPFKADVALVGAYLDLCQGLLLSGGPDLDPAAYGTESFHPKAEPIDPDRQRFEMALLGEVERRRTPVLGVCLGSQVMNVYRGGSLHQFLPEVDRPEALEHRKVGTEVKRHPAAVDVSTNLGAAIGTADLSVNTYHKQAVRQLGRGLRVVATAPDGIIEGFEDPTLPLFAAVQWHPERLAAEKEHLAVFRLLVERAGEGQP